MLHKRLFVVLLAPLFLASAFLAQKPGYSESIPYEPHDPGKKAGKRNAPTAPIVPAPTSNTGSDQIISVPVSVFDENYQFIHGLDKSNFRIFVDSQEASLVSSELIDHQVNVILFLDTSTSNYSLEAIQKNAEAIVSRIDASTKVMVIQFNISLKILCDPTNDRKQIEQAIKKITKGDGTSLYSAIRLLFQEILPPISGSKVVFLLSDGVDTTSKTSTYLNSLAEVEKTDVKVFPIYFDTLDFPLDSIRIQGPLSAEQLRQSGFFDDLRRARAKEYKIGKQYLGDLAAVSGGQLVAANELNSKKESKIGNELNLFYELKFKVNSLPVTDHRRQIRVRVDRPGLNVLARGSYIE